ncbi:putative mediator of RNA polymerase II transcription subunit [Clavispora lusitaniae]|nr:putative mediator of RNA polymerase II transcription subunit [Clavispora lusitaniae]
MQQKSVNLLKKIDATIYQILEKFQEMFDKAIIQDKSKESLAVESLTLEADALAIIRLCKDILTITRGLKETWCLGTMKVQQKDTSEASPEEVQQVFTKFNALLDRIAVLEKRQAIQVA